jgi:hypothetical protein
MSVLCNEDNQKITEIVRENIRVKYECILKTSMEILRNKMLEKIATMSKDVLQVSVNPRQSMHKRNKPSVG